MESQKPSGECPLHQEKIVAFCDDEIKALCFSCVATCKGKCHKVYFNANVIAKEKEDLMISLKLLESIYEKTKSMEEGIEELCATFSKSFDNNKVAIGHFFEFLRENTKKYEKSLNEYYDKYFQEQKAKLSAHLKMLRLRSDDLGRFLQNLKDSQPLNIEKLTSNGPEMQAKLKLLAKDFTEMTSPVENLLPVLDEFDAAGALEYLFRILTANKAAASPSTYVSFGGYVNPEGNTWAQDELPPFTKMEGDLKIFSSVRENELSLFDDYSHVMKEFGNRIDTIFQDIKLEKGQGQRAQVNSVLKLKESLLASKQAVLTEQELLSPVSNSIQPIANSPNKPLTKKRGPEFFGARLATSRVAEGNSFNERANERMDNIPSGKKQKDEDFDILRPTSRFENTSFDIASKRSSPISQQSSPNPNGGVFYQSYDREPEKITSRNRSALMSKDNECFLIYGGEEIGRSFFEFYRNNSSIQLKSPSTALPDLTDFSSVVDSPTSFLILGGSIAGRLSNKIFRFDLLKDKWSELELTLSRPKKNSKAVIGASNTLFVVGGIDRNEKILNEVEEIDLNFNMTVNIYYLKFARYDFCLAKDFFGNIIVIGGVGFDSLRGSNNALDVCEELDLKNSVVTKSSSLRRPRAGSAALSGKKNLFVVGGYDSVGVLTSVEKYNYESREWEIMPSLRNPRAFAAVAFAGRSEKFFVFGGQRDKTLRSVELWNGSSFEQTENMSELRSKFFAIKLDEKGCFYM